MPDSDIARLSSFKIHIERINIALEEFLDSFVPVIGEMGCHILSGNGKRLRPLFFILSTLLCNYRGNDQYQLSTIFEYIHAASLLHDDVLDNADLRRNKPSANKLWGNHASVLGGDFLIAKAFNIAMNSNNLEFLKRLTETSTKMTEGQILETVHTNDWDINKKTYLEIVTAKSAVLISAACACGAIISEAGKGTEQALKEFGLNVGIAFQLIDDLLDYTSSKDILGKPVGKDVREGKITLPLIYTLSKLKDDEKKRIADIFKYSHSTEQDYSDLIAIVRMNGVIDRVRDEAQSYIENADRCLSIFRDSGIKKDLMSLAQYTIERSC